MLRIFGNYKSLLLIGVILSASLALVFIQEANAHDGGGFDFTGNQVANYQDWMAGLPDNAFITELSIPGSHDSMAQTGGNIARTQVMSLEEQLDSGIRHIDIRIKWRDLVLEGPATLPCTHGNVGEECKFYTYHGDIIMGTTFEGDVLPKIRDFLNAHEDETIIMNLQQEVTDDTPRNKYFTEAMNNLLDNWDDDIDIFDRTCSTMNNEPNDGLDLGIAQLVDANDPNCSARGKLLIFIASWTHGDETDSDFLKHTMGAYDFQYPRERPIEYTYDKKTDLIDRWGDMEEALDDAATDLRFATLWFIDVAGSGSEVGGTGLVEPFFVASAHDIPGDSATHLWSLVNRPTDSLPDDKYKDFPRYNCVFECGVFMEGMNELVQLCLRGEKLHEGNFALDPRRVCDNTSQFKGRLGIVSADFPGFRLIQGIINSNDFNQSPTISAPASVDVDENTTGVTDVNSSDPEGETENGGGLTYSLSGTDYAKFSFDAEGNLEFKDAPNFETPTDDGEDNVYDVTVSVTDSGGLADSQAIGVTVNDVNEPPTSEAGGPYSGDEGSAIAIDGSGSTDPDEGDEENLIYFWSTDGGGIISDTSAATTDVTYPDNGAFTLTLKVTDPDGLEDTDTATVTVSNVKPTISPDVIDSEDENTAITITGSVSDPGWKDTFISGTVDWGDDTSLEDVSTSDFEQDQPNATMNYEATHTYGDNGVFTAEVCVTDDDGGQDCESVNLTINNVKPTIEEITNSPDPQDENSSVDFTAQVTDPGSDDLFFSWDWDDDTENDQESYFLVDSDNPDGLPTPTIDPRDETDNQTHTWGDNYDSYSVEFCVWDDDMKRDATFSDDDKVCETISVKIDNVNPTSEIDETDTLDIQGTPTFIGQINIPMEFTGSSEDPGSEDVTFTWDWDDDSPDSVETHYLVDSDNPDGLPSPSIDPRDLTDEKTKTWTKTCLYIVNLDANDDDSGTANDSTSVIIVGDDESNHGAGYWHSTVEKILSGKGKPKVNQETMQCYLDIANHMSAVFSEEISLSSLSEASNVFNDDDGPMSLLEQLDRQILAGWINFANGGVGLDDLVDTDGDKIGDTLFSNAIALAESVRLNPASGPTELEPQKEIVRYINLMDEN